MAATTAGALKAAIESMGLGLSAYRDGAPTNQDGTVAAPYPHVVVQEGIAYEPLSHGDYGDPTAHEAVTELVQVDLYQLARTLTAAGASVNAESYTLPGVLRARLHGVPLPLIGSQRVYGVRVLGGRRWPIADNIVRHTIDLLVSRDENRSS